MLQAQQQHQMCAPAPQDTCRSGSMLCSSGAGLVLPQHQQSQAQQQAAALLSGSLAGWMAPDAAREQQQQQLLQQHLQRGPAAHAAVVSLHACSMMPAGLGGGTAAPASAPAAAAAAAAAGASGCIDDSGEHDALLDEALEMLLSAYPDWQLEACGAAAAAAAGSAGAVAAAACAPGGVAQPDCTGGGCEHVAAAAHGGASSGSATPGHNTGPATASSPSSSNACGGVGGVNGGSGGIFGDVVFGLNGVGAVGSGSGDRVGHDTTLSGALSVLSLPSSGLPSGPLPDFFLGWPSGAPCSTGLPLQDAQQHQQPHSAAMTRHDDTAVVPVGLPHGGSTDSRFGCSTAAAAAAAAAAANGAWPLQQQLQQHQQQPPSAMLLGGCGAQQGCLAPAAGGDSMCGPLPSGAGCGAAALPSLRVMTAGAVLSQEAAMQQQHLIAAPAFSQAVSNPLLLTSQQQQQQQQQQPRSMAVFPAAAAVAAAAPSNAGAPAAFVQQQQLPALQQQLAQRQAQLHALQQQLDAVAGHSQQQLVRLSVKLHGVTPEQLPASTVVAMQRLLTHNAADMQAMLLHPSCRQGCIQMDMDVLVRSSSTRSSVPGAAASEHSSSSSDGSNSKLADGALFVVGCADAAAVAAAEARLRDALPFAVLAQLLHDLAATAADEAACATAADAANSRPPARSPIRAIYAQLGDCMGVWHAQGSGMQEWSSSIPAGWLGGPGAADTADAAGTSTSSSSSWRPRINAVAAATGSLLAPEQTAGAADAAGGAADAAGGAARAAAALRAMLLDVGVAAAATAQADASARMWCTQRGRHLSLVCTHTHRQQLQPQLQAVVGCPAHEPGLLLLEAEQQLEPSQLPACDPVACKSQLVPILACSSPAMAAEVAGKLMAVQDGGQRAELLLQLGLLLDCGAMLQQQRQQQQQQQQQRQQRQQLDVRGAWQQQLLRLPSYRRAIR
jgi:hypothetical protein